MSALVTIFDSALNRSKGRRQGLGSVMKRVLARRGLRLLATFRCPSNVRVAVRDLIKNLPQVDHKEGKSAPTGGGRKARKTKALLNRIADQQARIDSEAHVEIETRAACTRKFQTQRNVRELIRKQLDNLKMKGMALLSTPVGVSLRLSVTRIRTTPIADLLRWRYIVPVARTHYFKGYTTEELYREALAKASEWTRAPEKDKELFWPTICKDSEHLTVVQLRRYENHLKFRAQVEARDAEKLRAEERKIREELVDPYHPRASEKRKKELVRTQLEHQQGGWSKSFHRMAIGQQRQEEAGRADAQNRFEGVKVLTRAGPSTMRGRPPRRGRGGGRGSDTLDRSSRGSTSQPILPKVVAKVGPTLSQGGAWPANCLGGGKCSKIRGEIWHTNKCPRQRKFDGEKAY